jgi:hypothetical protein
MSKKNNLQTRARRHAHDLQREKEAAQKKQEVAAKREQKVGSKGITKAKLRKRKTVRLKKGKFVKVRPLSSPLAFLHFSASIDSPTAFALSCNHQRVQLTKILFEPCGVTQ